MTPLLFIFCYCYLFSSTILLYLNRCIWLFNHFSGTKTSVGLWSEYSFWKKNHFSENRFLSKTQDSLTHTFLPSQHLSLVFFHHPIHSGFLFHSVFVWVSLWVMHGSLLGMLKLSAFQHLSTLCIGVMQRGGKWRPTQTHVDGQEGDKCNISS